MAGQPEDWVLLAYRLPRLPSGPRSAVWRKLRQLGAAQLSDGLVALPADARTREQLEWIAEDVTDHGGEAAVWLGRPLDPGTAAAIADRMSAAVAAEYEVVTAEAAEAARDSDGAARRRTLARLRREMRRIAGRDFFPTSQRDAARAAVESLAHAPRPQVRA